MSRKVEEINSLTLAYIGDAIYEIYVREYLIKKGISKVNDLQKEAVNYVSAVNQKNYLEKLIDSSFLDDNELEIVKRARNHKVSSSPRKVDITTYKWATGLEALVGYLYLTGNNDRVKAIMSFILGG